MSKLKIESWSPKDDATFWYRVKFPFQALAEKGLIEFKTHIGEDVTVSPDSQVAVFQRTGLSHIALMRQCKADGKRVIYDIDDDLPNLDPSNPANLIVSPNREVAARHHRALLNNPAMKLVGEQFQLLYRMETRDVAEMAMRNFNAIIQSMKVADVVTVSTESLRKTYRGWGIRNVVVLPNHEKLGEWRGVTKAPLLGRVVIGWAGGISHAFTDIKPIAHSVIRVLNENPNAHLHIIGVPELREQFFAQQFIADRVFAEEWQGWERYKEIIAEFDIALAPSFGTTKFAQGKSDIRCLQAWINGIPTVASELTYGASTRESQGGLVANNPSEWYSGILHLVRDGDLRRAVGARGKDYVYSQRTYEANCAMWLEAYRESQDGH